MSGNTGKRAAVAGDDGWEQDRNRDRERAQLHDRTCDPVFAEEQDHLSRTYETLLDMRSQAVRKLEQTDAQAAADKLSMAEDIAPNFDTFDDTLETLAAFSAVNRIIDNYNIAQDLSVRRLTDIELLLKQPYFAKIVLRYGSSEDARELYIGAAGISDDMYKRMVVDWRSPVAEVFYNQENGRTSYKANGRTIEVDLLLRRQFDIAGPHLKAYFDTTVAIQDPMLLESLAKQRTDKLQAITTTIQKEQNVVVRHEDVPALLVSGVAGSGKTSVMLQRIAYLFYQMRETLKPSQVFLITPNPVFARYIDNVLPEMGESNPRSLTWSDLMARLLLEGRHTGSLDVPLEVFEQIERSVSDIELTRADYVDIRAGGRTLVSAAQIEQLMRKFAGAKAGPHRITLVREALLERIEARLAGDRLFREMRDEVSALPIEEQIRLFGVPVDMIEGDAAAELRDHIRTMIDERYGGALRAAENDEWLRIDRIGMRVLGVKSLGSLDWLYMKMALTGFSDPDARYVFIDEVQDYTLSQLYVLAAYFRRAHFIMLGDENQSITPGTATFAQIEQLFEEKFGEISVCSLNISYRSTPAITELFAKLMPDGGIDISSVQRSDVPPDILPCEDVESYRRELRRAVGSAIEDAQREDGILTAVIVPWKGEIKRIVEALGDEAPAVIDSAESLPERGVVLIPLKLAKGLEFDHVIIPDASARLFPDDDISRRRLYTSISRATKGVTILSNGKLTQLLAQ